MISKDRKVQQITEEKWQTLKKNVKVYLALVNSIWKVSRFETLASINFGISQCYYFSFLIFLFYNF